MTLDILYLYGSFSGMAKKYAAMHLGDVTDKELDEAKSEGERIESKYKKAVHELKLTKYSFQFVKKDWPLDGLSTPWLK